MGANARLFLFLFAFYLTGHLTCCFQPKFFSRNDVGLISTSQKKRVLNTLEKTLKFVSICFVSTSPARAFTLKSDEIEVDVLSQRLGLGLAEINYKNSVRVVVQSIKDYADDTIKSAVKPGMIIVSVSGMNVEGRNGNQIVEDVRAAPRPMRLVFRDPSIFFEKLNSSTATDAFVTTTVRPYTATAPEQVIEVERIEVMCADFRIFPLLLYFNEIVLLGCESIGS